MRVAAPLGAAPRRRITYHKAQYSRECNDGIEYSACMSPPPGSDEHERVIFLLWNALNSLPEIQGHRVDAHIILGKA